MSNVKGGASLSTHLDAGFNSFAAKNLTPPELLTHDFEQNIAKG